MQKKLEIICLKKRFFPTFLNAHKHGEAAIYHLISKINLYIFKAFNALLSNALVVLKLRKATFDPPPCLIQQIEILTMEAKSVCKSLSKETMGRTGNEEFMANQASKEYNNTITVCGYVNHA